MDWSKAKNILIITLIITNILLGLDLLLVKDDVELFDDDVVRDTMSILNDKDIYIYEEISTEQKDMPVLEVEYDDMTKENIDEAINNQEGISYPGINEKETIQRAEDFLKKNNLFDDDMKLQEPIVQKDNQYILTYKKYYERIALEECHMIVTLEEGVIMDIDRIWLNALHPGKTTKKTIPATTALLKFASTLPEDVDKPVIITEIERAYWVKTSAHDQEITMKDTALPAWKITYNQGVDYILAYEN